MRTYFKYIIFLFFATLFQLNTATAQTQPDSTAVEDSILVTEDDEDELEVLIDSVYNISIPTPPPNFKFDTIHAPSSHLYNKWDTMVIDPYREDLLANADTVDLILGDSNDCFFYPPCTNNITSGFGYRRWGRGYLKFHYGIDFGLKTGDKVYAAFDGIIRIAKFSQSYGYVVVIRHYNGIETLYGHFSKLLVYTGQQVQAGDPIGLGGSTGWSTGSHLHLEVRYKGKPIDPSKIIAFDQKKLFCDTLHLNPEYFAHLKQAKAMYQNGKNWGAYKPKKGVLYHKVRRGETIYKIAYKYRTTVNKICKLNRISKRTKLKPGRVIRVR